MNRREDKDNLNASLKEGEASEIRYRRLLESARNGIDNLDVVNEIRYRRLFESNRDGILMLDGASRKITDANPFMIELLGYSKEEFLGKELWEIGLLKDEEASRAAFRELQQKGYIRYTDLPLETKNGVRRNVEFISNVYTEDNRQIIQCNIHDITGRKAAENALAKLTSDLESAAAEYQRVLDHSLDVICQINAAGQFTQISAAAKNVWGYSPEELIGRAYMELVHPEDHLITAQAAGDVMSGIPAVTFENQYIRQDGAIAHIMWSANWSKSDQIMFCVARDVSPIKQAEDALKKSEANYLNLIESSPGIIYLNEPHPPYKTIYVSPNIIRFGYSPEEWYSTPGMWMSILHNEDRERVLNEFETAVRENLETDLEYRIVAKDGTIYWWRDKGSFLLNNKGNRTGWQGLILDITSEKELREQLRQSQKLESVGLLAGGIAHDFNNMLTAINGYSDLTLRKLKADDPLRRNIEEIKRAGERSAELTHQLLAFSRQQILYPVILDLNEAISDTIKLLQRVIGENIQLSTTLNPQVGRVKVDPGQLSQILMNLAVNARDSMPQGGKLTIETANVFLDPDYVRQHVGVLPGAYTMLAVSDTGIGMSDETKEHIFDPFFTTKEVGQGTGLGLATVYGIVKQSGGSIGVHSKEGVGTTFKIYLPRVTEQVTEIKTEKSFTEMPKGTETILLVEDEEIVRKLTVKILEECGYTVIEAANGVKALVLCDKGEYQYDLLMTDVVMPEMGGRELSEKLKERLPNLRVLFTSGYTDDAVVRHGVIEVNTNFIQKPFSAEALADKIREILDNPDKS
jgi:PAS domain S-box-containing protein